MASKADRQAAREQLYEKIIISAREGLARYYMEFPDRIGDVRAKDALEWSLRGVSRLLRIIDEYEVSYRSAEEFPTSKTKPPA
jgi:hypothetical protein